MDYKEESLLFGFQKFGKWSDTFSFNPKLLQVAEKLQTRRHFFFFLRRNSMIKTCRKASSTLPQLEAEKSLLAREVFMLLF